MDSFRLLCREVVKVSALCGAGFLHSWSQEVLWYKNESLCKVCNAVLVLHNGIPTLYNAGLASTRAVLVLHRAFLFVHNDGLVLHRAVHVCTRAVLYLHKVNKVLSKAFLVDAVRWSVSSWTLQFHSKLTSYGYFRDLFSR
jgi:hypothetical protein